MLQTILPVGLHLISAEPGNCFKRLPGSLLFKPQETSRPSPHTEFVPDCQTTVERHSSAESQSFQPQLQAH
jgi:hypothetical protein